RERRRRRADAAAQRVVEAQARTRPLAARILAHREDAAPLEDRRAAPRRGTFGSGRTARRRSDPAPRTRSARPTLRQGDLTHSGDFTLSKPCRWEGQGTSCARRPILCGDEVTDDGSLQSTQAVEPGNSVGRGGRAGPFGSRSRTGPSPARPAFPRAARWRAASRVGDRSRTPPRAAGGSPARARGPRG